MSRHPDFECRFCSARRAPGYDDCWDHRNAMQERQDAADAEERRAATDREIVRVVRETMLPIGRDFSMSAMTDQLEELLTKEGEGTR